MEKKLVLLAAIISAVHGSNMSGVVGQSQGSYQPVYQAQTNNVQQQVAQLGQVPSQQPQTSQQYQQASQQYQQQQPPQQPSINNSDQSMNPLQPKQPVKNALTGAAQSVLQGTRNFFGEVFEEVKPEIKEKIKADLMDRPYTYYPRYSGYNAGYGNYYSGSGNQYTGSANPYVASANPYAASASTTTNTYAPYGPNYYGSNAAGYGYANTMPSYSGYTTQSSSSNGYTAQSTQPQTEPQTQTQVQPQVQSQVQVSDPNCSCSIPPSVAVSSTPTSTDQQATQSTQPAQAQPLSVTDQLIKRKGMFTYADLLTEPLPPPTSGINNLSVI